MNNPSNRISLYAVLGNKRLLQAPGIPTTAEQGLPELQMSVWHGLWAPKGTPKPVIAKISAAVDDALQAYQVRRRPGEAVRLAQPVVGEGVQL